MRFHLLVLLLLLVPFALAANDPGHDSLYVLRIGDNLTGNFNISGNITASLVQATSRFFGPNLDIRGDGTSSTAATRIIAGPENLELSTQSGGVFLEKDGGTVWVGATATSADLYVNGSIRINGTLVCTSDGTNCPSASGSSRVRDIEVEVKPGGPPNSPQIGH